jgi:hypothetical protein
MTAPRPPAALTSALAAAQTLARLTPARLTLARLTLGLTALLALPVPAQTPARTRGWSSA